MSLKALPLQRRVPFSAAWSWVKRTLRSLRGKLTPQTQSPSAEAVQARAKLDALHLPYTAAGFLAAATAGDLRACNLFLTAGMSVDEVFDKVARAGCTHVVRALLLHRPSPQARGNALIWAAHGNHHELVELLLGQVDLHRYGSEALWWAAHCNNWRTMERLLSAMAAANARVQADDPWVVMTLEKTHAPRVQGFLPRLLALGANPGS